MICVCNCGTDISNERAENRQEVSRKEENSGAYRSITGWQKVMLRKSEIAEIFNEIYIFCCCFIKRRKKNVWKSKSLRVGLHNVSFYFLLFIVCEGVRLPMLVLASYTKLFSGRSIKKMRVYFCTDKFDAMQH